MKNTLIYWKSRLIDARQAAESNLTREYVQALRFARRKVYRLEQIAFTSSRSAKNRNLSG